jgi:hypothetical protein
MPHEVVGMGNFMPRIADNAEALIDYALSHIPPSEYTPMPLPLPHPRRQTVSHAST